jgi:hypothetical protein
MLPAFIVPSLEEGIRFDTSLLLVLLPWAVPFECLSRVCARQRHHHLPPAAVCGGGALSAGASTRHCGLCASLQGAARLCLLLAATD